MFSSLPLTMILEYLPAFVSLTAVVDGMDLRVLGWLDAAKMIRPNNTISATKPAFFIPRRLPVLFLEFGRRGFLSIGVHYTLATSFFLALRSRECQVLLADFQAGAMQHVER